jgi:hypothetical protein
VALRGHGFLGVSIPLITNNQPIKIMSNPKSYTVDISSFSIDEKTRNKVEAMNYDQQRKWLSKKVAEGWVDIVAIYPDED